MPKYITVREVCERLAITKVDHILNAIRRGELAAVNIGSGSVRPTWRISEESFAAFVEKRTARPALAAKKRSRKPQLEEVTKYFSEK